MKLKHNLKLGKHFSRFKYCDAELTRDGLRSIPVHRTVLASVSTKFENLFDSNCHSSSPLVVEDVDFDSLEKIINFIYSGEIVIGDNRKDDLVAEAMENLQLDLTVCCETNVREIESYEVKQVFENNNESDVGCANSQNTEPPPSAISKEFQGSVNIVQPPNLAEELDQCPDFARGSVITPTHCVDIPNKSHTKSKSYLKVRTDLFKYSSSPLPTSKSSASVTVSPTSKSSASVTVSPTSKSSASVTVSPTSKSSASVTVSEVPLSSVGFQDPCSAYTGRKIEEIEFLPKATKYGFKPDPEVATEDSIEPDEEGEYVEDITQVDRKKEPNEVPSVDIVPISPNQYSSLDDQIPSRKKNSETSESDMENGQNKPRSKSNKDKKLKKFGIEESLSNKYENLMVMEKFNKARERPKSRSKIRTTTKPKTISHSKGRTPSRKSSVSRSESRTLHRRSRTPVRRKSPSRSRSQAKRSSVSRGYGYRSSVRRKSLLRSKNRSEVRRRKTYEQTGSGKRSRSSSRSELRWKKNKRSFPPSPVRVLNREPPRSPSLTRLQPDQVQAKLDREILLIMNRIEGVNPISKKILESTMDGCEEISDTEMNFAEEDSPAEQKAFGAH